MTASKRPSGSEDRAKEAASLIAALSPDDRAVWATAMYAGLRRGELRALRWSDGLDVLLPEPCSLARVIRADLFRPRAEVAFVASPLLIAAGTRCEAGSEHGERRK